ncbi:MAG: sulfotransferase family 2 domain-containing protein [Candidatus Hodarchaeota archaeon]
MLAFVHIKKAAGTTLNHIMRINYIFRHCDVKVLEAGSDDVFRAADMKHLLKINPFVASISGHEVRPYGDLRSFIPSIKFITLLRDPVKRYLSQYQHNYEILGEKLAFSQYLNTESSFNKQTRTIAGCDDVELAKEILARRFFLVGTVEAFDEFLVILKNKIKDRKLHLGYKKQNIRNEKSALRKSLDEKYEEYKERIIERNLLDIELYRYVNEVLLPLEREKYGKNLQKHVEDFKATNTNFYRPLFRYLDFGYRKLYFQPMIQYVRRKNRLS